MTDSYMNHYDDTDGLDYSRIGMLLKVIELAVAHGPAFSNIIAEANFELKALDVNAAAVGAERAKAKAEAAAKARADEQARIDQLAAEEEAKLKAEADAKADAEIKTKAQVTAAAQAKAEADVKAKAEAEAATTAPVEPTDDTTNERRV